MNIAENKETILISGVKCFDLDLTLGCGQAFRWQKCENGRWRGIAFGKTLIISQNSDGILVLDTSVTDFEQVWRGYFDLDRNYSLLCEGFCADSSLKTAVEQFPGIRILRQEPWEALCSFIISQNNNIPRIKGIVERLCSAFGENISNGDFTFPSARTIAKLGVEDLAPVRAGFRAKYIIDAAAKVASGEIVLENLAVAPLDEARGELMKMKGVGLKVAECALLYGCGRHDAFPVDVWVKRIMEELYPAGFPACAAGAQGIAQQYLFHWRRTR